MTMSYPKWLYHPTEKATVVEDEAARKALGPGWVESPADLVAPEPKKVEAPHKPSGPSLTDKPEDVERHPKKVK